MSINKAHIRLIFGLKIRQLRQSQDLSITELAKATGISISYLNEIEKGKKYPKPDKILLLSQVLKVNYDELVSLQLSKKLAPITDLLRSGILDALSLEMFGLETSTLLALISEAPSKINAFISTILSVARSYEIRRENFYLAALRAYQEMNDNYFDSLEKEVDRFVKEFRLSSPLPPSVSALEDILFEDFSYTLDRHSLNQHPHLKHFRSVSAPHKTVLHLNQGLSAMQEAFILAKEIAFQYLKLAPRPYTYTVNKVHSFEEVLNNYKASYFAVALLMRREALTKDVQAWFQEATWDASRLEELLEKYQATPEMFFHRLASLIPQHFGMANMFFLRMEDEPNNPNRNYQITKELHLSGQHNPHSNDLNEHYCRRWNAIQVLQNMKQNPGEGKYLIQVQRSHFLESGDEYLVISVGRPGKIFPQVSCSISMGIRVDVNSRKAIRFLTDPHLPFQLVNKTCERCKLTDCQSRVAAPSIIEEQAQQQQVDQALSQLLQG